MLSSAMQLFREHGYSATGIRDVIAHSGAPRGSIYHYFPGGKPQIAAEAVAAAGQAGQEGLKALAQAFPGDPVAALGAFIGAWRQVLESEDFRAGCPVVAVAIESHDTDQPSAAVAEAFASWQAVLAASMTGVGVPQARAASLATLIVAAVEGAVILCRARRDGRPLEDIRTELVATLRSAVPG
ncbi:TetR/AcrR family transcriptional regulator [Pseudonocardiaceae bacterium YIM PH 21723]|nr:TetR/AcrR family transcriptional regulator [Pseudonocardiaceae bacterium YIM PH 21723]